MSSHVLNCFGTGEGSINETEEETEERQRKEDELNGVVKENKKDCFDKWCGKEKAPTPDMQHMPVQQTFTQQASSPDMQRSPAQQTFTFQQPGYGGWVQQQHYGQAFTMQQPQYGHPYGTQYPQAGVIGQPY